MKNAGILLSLGTRGREPFSSFSGRDSVIQTDTQTDTQTDGFSTSRALPHAALFRLAAPASQSQKAGEVAARAASMYRPGVASASPIPAPHGQRGGRWSLTERQCMDSQPRCQHGRHVPLQLIYQRSQDPAGFAGAASALDPRTGRRGGASRRGGGQRGRGRGRAQVPPPLRTPEVEARTPLAGTPVGAARLAAEHHRGAPVARGARCGATAVYRPAAAAVRVAAATRPRCGFSRPPPQAAAAAAAGSSRPRGRQGGAVLSIAVAAAVTAPSTRRRGGATRRLCSAAVGLWLVESVMRHLGSRRGARRTATGGLRLLLKRFRVRSLFFFLRELFGEFFFCFRFFSQRGCTELSIK